MPMAPREGKGRGIGEHELRKMTTAREKSGEGLAHAYRTGCKIGSGSDLLGDVQADRATGLERKGQVMKPMDDPAQRPLHEYLPRAPAPGPRRAPRAVAAAVTAAGPSLDRRRGGPETRAGVY